MKPRIITKVLLAIMTTVGSVRVASAQDDAVTILSPGSFGLSVLQSDQDFAVNDGKLVISAIDKALHSAYSLEMNDINVGVINILNSDEGIEG